MGTRVIKQKIIIGLGLHFGSSPVPTRVTVDSQCTVGFIFELVRVVLSYLVSLSVRLGLLVVLQTLEVS